MDRFEVPRGTRDFLPDEMAVRNHVERVARDALESFGFQQIQTPTFESFDLFASRSGEAIRESMFTFASDAGRYALRPELTAAVCRVVASGALASAPLPYKLYYLGPCFRYCKPREGRYREFFQIGTELIGAAGELADAEIIALAIKVLRNLEIPGVRLRIGNVGILQKLLEQQRGDNNQLRHDWDLEVLHDIDRLMHITDLCHSLGRQPELAPNHTAGVCRERTWLLLSKKDIQHHGHFAKTRL
jgi:histidyl-tRNA synthetase